MHNLVTWSDWSMALKWILFYVRWWQLFLNNFGFYRTNLRWTFLISFNSPFFSNTAFRIPVQKLPNLFPRSDPGPIGFSTCSRRVAYGLARVGTTSDYDRQDYFQILCCGRDIVVTILKLKCQMQNVHGEFESTESLVKFLISAL